MFFALPVRVFLHGIKPRRALAGVSAATQFVSNGFTRGAGCVCCSGGLPARMKSCLFQHPQDRLSRGGGNPCHTSNAAKITCPGACGFTRCAQVVWAPAYAGVTVFNVVVFFSCSHIRRPKQLCCGPGVSAGKHCCVFQRLQHRLSRVRVDRRQRRLPAHDHLLQDLDYANRVDSPPF